MRNVEIALHRIRIGRPAKSVLLIGLRGVGKTVLLDRMRGMANGMDYQTLRIEAPEGRSLPAMLAPELRRVLHALSHTERAKDQAMRGMRALAGFVNKLRLKYKDIEVSVEAEPEPGLADNGDLEQDLAALLQTIGEAARATEQGVALFIDEIQYVKEEQLQPLITALHRCSQDQLPVTLVGAGLPQLRGKMGEAKSYAERLFEFPNIGALSGSDATQALRKPIEEEGGLIEEDAIDHILDRTQCYPYFLQEWGKQAWDVAKSPAITYQDVETASALATAALDQSFFGVRFDRVTPLEKVYLRAMADLGSGPHRSGDIAERMGREATNVAPTRANLIHKGMVWSPSHGDTAFTVPLFDQYMRRVMPGDDWL